MPGRPRSPGSAPLCLLEHPASSWPSGLPHCPDQEGFPELCTLSQQINRTPGKTQDLYRGERHRAHPGLGPSNSSGVW